MLESPPLLTTIILLHAEADGFNHLARHLINPARVLIPRLLRSPMVPFLKEWVEHVDHIHDMDSIMHYKLDALTHFNNTWQAWKDFQSSETYKAINGPN